MLKRLGVGAAAIQAGSMLRGSGAGAATAQAGAQIRGWEGSAALASPPDQREQDAITSRTIARTNRPPEEVGEWSEPIPGPYDVTAVHSALLHTGEVLLLASTLAYVWNPVTGAAVQANAPEDLFCSGHSILGNGDVLFAGGPFIPGGATKVIYSFNPATRAWLKWPDMRQGRYYPTCVTLPDGRNVLIFGGRTALGGPVNEDVELFKRGVQIVATRDVQLFPHSFVMPDGTVVVQGIFREQSMQLDTNTWSFTDLPRRLQKQTDSSGILLPGAPSGSWKVMLNGGNASPSAEILDVSDLAAGWTSTAPMPTLREHMNLVILPDGRLLGVGGIDPATDIPQHDSLMYEPAADLWTTMAMQTEERAYHSTAVLLPDGRVLSAGATSPTGGQDKLELYSPPYLFRGARPTILDAPAHVTWSQEFSVFTNDAIERAVLMRPCSVTHTVDMNQRHVELAFSPRAGRIRATAPASPTIAPRGFYMLFILNGLGVPSEARWIVLS